MPEIDPLTEVLAVSVDVDTFTSGLQELKRLWEQFVADIGSENLDKAISAGSGLSGTKDEFKVLGDTITRVFEGVAAQVGELTTAIQATMAEAISDASVLEAKTKIAGTGAGARGYDDTDAQARADSEMDASLQHRRDAQRTASEEIAVEQQGLVDRFEELEQRKYEIAFQELVKEEEAQKKFAQTIAIEQEGVVNQFEEQQLRKQTIAEAAAARIATAQEKLAQEISIEQEGIVVKAEEAEAKRVSAAEVSAAKILSANRRLAEEIEVEQQGIVDQYIASQAKMAESAEAAALKEKEAQEKAANSGGLFGSGGMAEDLGRIIRFAAEWQLVGAAINGVMEVIAAPFHAVEQGMNYLRATEKAADDLSGVLLANVRYAGNLADNFSKANEAATQVVRALQDIAAKDNIDPQQLTDQFKNVVEAGGARGATTTGDLVKLTEDFSLAFKALGVNAQGARREIYNALNGTPQAGSRFLEIVGMTADQWIRVRTEAYAAGNIVDVLAPKFQPYLDATQQAASHQQDLINKLTLLKERLEAVFAQPLFDQFTSFLTRFTTWIEDNKGGLETMAMTIGSIASSIVEMGAALGMAVFAPPGWNTHKKPGMTPSDMMESRGHGDVTGLDKQLFDPSVVQNVLAKSGNPLDAPITSIRTPPPTTKQKAEPSEMPDEMVEFETELRRIKAVTKEKQDEEKLAVASRTKSQEQSTKDVLGYLTQENAAVQALVDKYKALVSAAKDAKTPAGKQRIKTTTDRLTGIGQASTDSLNNAGRASILEDISTQQKAQDEGNKQSLAGVEKTLREELALKQAIHKEGDSSEEQLLAAEMAAQSKAHEARQAIYLSEAAEAGQNTQAQETAFTSLTQANEAYTAEILRLYGLRVDALQTETRKQQEHVVAQAALKAEASSESTQIREGFSGTPDLTKFTTRTADLNQERQQKQNELTIAQTKAGGADEVRKLQDEISKIDLEKLKNVAAYLAAIRGDSQLSQSSKQKLEVSAVDGQDAQTKQDAADALKTTGDHEVQQKLMGDPDALSKILDPLTAASEKAGLALQAMGTAATLVQNVMNAMAQGRKQGGTVGGIGAGLSAASGTIGAIGDATGIPGLGEAASAVGSIMSMIGSSLMAETVRLANTIKNSISSTNEAYSAQSQNMAVTLQQLQAERANAVSSLSGQKGGWDQLTAILQQLDPEIQSLIVQTNQLQLSFAQAYNAAQIQVQYNTDALSSVYTQWTQINAQVLQYINSGGDAAVAAQYLSDQLLLVQKASQQTLDSGDQQAINDAINLNNLLLQRTQLVQSLNTQAFALQNQDSTERTEAGVVTRAEQLQQQQRDSQVQLNDLNYQITTAQLQVAAESQVFTIAQNIADLHRQDDALTMTALNLQLAQYTALQGLVASITQGANGLFSSTEGFLQPQNNPIGPTITLTGTVINVVSPTADPVAFGAAIADSLTVEIAAASRNAPYGN